MNTFLINSLEELPEAAKWLAEKLKGEKLIAFEGEMGAGKTTIIQSLCRFLGVKTEVTSPTFALVNEYSAGNGSSIYHFDFYRIENPEEALDFGLEEYLASDCLCFMEWSEKVDIYLPENLQRVYIEEQADQSRLLQLS